MEDSDQIPRSEKCDLFTGDWIPNPSSPIYSNESCHLIESHQNCLKNGRPDTGYLYWWWNPRDCELPQFDSEKFLELMRDKTWALIGRFYISKPCSVLALLALRGKCCDSYSEIWCCFWMFE
ncbi:hypothetical protein ACSBR1_003621 [Camellia fascicularis]